MKRDYRRRKRSSLAQQLRQLGDVHGDAPRLVVGVQVRHRATARLLRVVDVGQRLPIV
jgi:hypothetical protein